MKKTYSIEKSRLYGAADYSAVMNGGDFRGYSLKRVTTEEIEVNTGAICFFDPYNPGRGRPFTVEFPKGKYKPFMFLISTSNGDRVALAGLDGGELCKAVEWKLAFTDERDVLKLLTGGDTAGVTVGSGFGAFCDISVFGDFIQLVKDGENSFHPLDGAVNMDGSCAQICKLKNVVLPIFSTGWGEGCYSAYIGLDADGGIKGFICDFSMVERPPEKSDGDTVEFEFEVSEDELYIPDPKKSDAENSIARYSLVIDGKDASAEALFNAYSRRGYSYHTTEKYDEALSDYLAALEIGRLNSWIPEFAMHAWSLYDNAANICRSAGRTDEAINLYKEACRASDTFYGGAYAGLIDVYRDNKDYKKALAAADEMVAARPQDPSAYLKRSEIYTACEEYEKAISDLDVLIEVFKLNESILDKALCLSFLGKYKEALGVLDTYLLDGRASEVYYDIRAGIHIADNNFAAAYSDSLKALDVNPDYLNTLEKLIELDGLLFNFKGVIKWATRYAESFPRTEYAYSVRAAAYAEMGEYDDAVEDYIHLIRITKNEPKYYGLLIKTALFGGYKGLAKRYSKMLRKLDSSYYIYAMGVTYLSQAKFARAERYLASAFALREDDVILSSLIDCYLESGRIDKAEFAMLKYAEVADAEDAYVKSAAISKTKGVLPIELKNEYVARFLGNCEDAALTDKVLTYFENIK